MDPIKEGSKIFVAIAKQWTDDHVAVPGDVDAFLRDLRARTEGCVIVDFLDTANWDCLAGHDYDPNTSYLQLYWHDFRASDAARTGGRELSRVAFPASLYGLFLHLQQIRILRSERTAAFLLKGYALTPKDAKRQLQPGSEEFQFDQENLFSAHAVRKINGQWHLLDAHTASLYTIAILPKNTGLSSFDSRRLLFDVNLADVIARLHTAQQRLEALSDSARDEISEKGNTIRRALEYALKIEICYRELLPQKPYSQLQLGDLLRVLRPFHTDAVRTLLGKIAEWANELSHDTGKPIARRKAALLALLGMAYVELLKSQIHLHGFAPNDQD